MIVWWQEGIGEDNHTGRGLEDNLVQSIAV